MPVLISTLFSASSAQCRGVNCCSARITPVDPRTRRTGYAPRVSGYWMCWRWMTGRKRRVWSPSSWVNSSPLQSCPLPMESCSSWTLPSWPSLISTSFTSVGMGGLGEDHHSTLSVFDCLLTLLTLILATATRDLLLPEASTLIERLGLQMNHTALGNIAAFDYAAEEACRFVRATIGFVISVRVFRLY